MCGKVLKIIEVLGGIPGWNAGHDLRIWLYDKHGKQPHWTGRVGRSVGGGVADLSHWK